MSRPDTLIPPAPSPIDEDTRPNRGASERENGLPCALWLLVLMLLLVIASLAGIILYRPEVVGLGAITDLTQTQVGFVGTTESLAGTARALEGGAATNAQAAFENETTRAANAITQTALADRQQAFDQQATQSALDQQATQTAVFAANAQQTTANAIAYQQTQAAYDQTQAAVNVTGTQAALQATQSAFQFQGTQAAINQNATAVALGFATPTPAPVDFLSETPAPPPLLDERFAEGFREGTWTYSAVADWRFAEADGALTAAGVTNWLMTQQADFQNYTFDVDLTVLQGAGLISFNYLLLNIPAEPNAPGGLALELAYDGTRLTAVGLYRVTRAQLLEQEFLSARALDAVQAVQVVDGPLATETAVRVEVRAGRIAAAVGGQVIFDLTLDAALTPGAVGIYVPVGSQVRRLTVRP